MSRSMSASAILSGLQIFHGKLVRDHPDITWDFIEIAEYVIGELETPPEAGNAPQPSNAEEPPHDSVPVSPSPKAPSAGDANSGAE
ncbi:unnamed protein product [Linum trigynum]|uniref:Uncharacterized protein n=1 Tax=Linum trigynum TaxID=586398 RepID=A0AAV2GJV5_9ROSI